METRSIDTAKNASIDLMTLNKKVVNMRSTVRRSKAHIISKLTKNIAGLKQKKGTDQEKEKNLQKAQRYLDEIQSIRSLKDDKITKYSIANVSTFEQVSKSTLSSGARALARLADHHFMKDAVNQFREEHSDWRDLAAFMLMQQTGRKFKSQKHKDKKIVSRAENINASKLMTTAYTQGLFREEGFPKIEETTEKKKKKKKEKKKDENEDDQNVIEKKEPTEILSVDHKDDKGEMLKQKNIKVKQNNKSVITLEINKDDLKRNIVGDEQERSEKKIGNLSVEQNNLITKDRSNSVTVGQENLKESENEKQISDKETSEEEDEKEEEENEEEEDSEEGEESEEEKVEDVDEKESDGDDDEEEEESDEMIAEIESDGEEEGQENSEEELSQHKTEASDKPQKDQEPLAKKKISNRNKECVVKQLNIGGGSSGSEDSENEIVSDSSSDDDDDDESENDQESDSEEVKESEPEKGKLSKRAFKKKGKTVPDFLIKSDGKPRRLPRDPFFEGSDMEEDYNYNDYEEDGGEEEDDTDIQEKFKGNKKLTKSLFYKPGDEKRLLESSVRRKDAFDSDRGRGRGRGRDGLSSRGRGRGGFQDRGRGGNDRRGRGRGSFQFGSHDKFDRTRKPQFDGKQNDKQFNSSSSARSKFFTSQADSVTASKPAEKLHPSWEASRKRKAEQAGIKAFSGTKITFGDDD